MSITSPEVDDHVRSLLHNSLQFKNLMIELLKEDFAVDETDAELTIADLIKAPTQQGY